MKKNVGRIFNNRIVEGNKNIISKGEGFVSKESAVFIRTNNGFEGENPEPPVPPVHTNRLYYTVVEGSDKPESDWISENCKKNFFNSRTGEGYLELKPDVTAIGSVFGNNNSTIKSIEIPLQVTRIYDYSFTYYSQLTSITLSENLTNVGYNSFGNCDKLHTINYNIIDGNANFRGMSQLTTVNIGNSVTTIPSEMCKNCTGLTSITIPESVTKINTYAFEGCTGLTTVNFNAINCDTSGTTYALIFKNCTSISTFNIGESVVKIPESICKGLTGITSITIPDSVTDIDMDAFSGCTGITAITFGNSIENIGYNAFYNCSGLTELHLPNTIKSLGISAFNYCTGLTSLTFTNSITSLGSNVFANCTSLSSVTLPRITEIPTYMFGYCTGLTSVVIPNSVTSIGTGAFRGCTALTDISLSRNITSIEVRAFDHCSSLTSFTIPEAVTSIGMNAFEGCIGLTSITIPEAVEELGGEAFKSCSGLTTINFNAINCSNVNMPGSQNYYAIFDGCSNVVNLNIGNSVTKIPRLAFASLHITSLTIPSSVTTIENGAFISCTGLTSLVFPNVETIKDEAFSGCSGLTSIDLSASTTTIGYMAFRVYNLTTVICRATTPPYLHWESFKAANDTLYVPSDSVAAYQTDTMWNSSFETITAIV